MDLPSLLVGLALGALIVGGLLGRRAVAASRAALGAQAALVAERGAHAQVVGAQREQLAQLRSAGQEQLSLTRAIDPIATQLRRLEREVGQLERDRRRTQGSLEQLLGGVGGQLEQLRSETGALVSALRRPHVRGAWGELALRNCVRAAGMTARVDFHEQRSVAGGKLRPDMTVALPNGGVVVVDAKVPLDAYLEALDGDEAQLGRHARQLRAHVDALAGKGYHAHVADSPAFVVCFVPNEAVYAAALDHDPELLGHGAARGVLIATPTTLLALLHAVAFGWREEAVERSALEIADAARELHRRCEPFLQAFSALGLRLDEATGAYNRAVGSLEARVLPQLRRIERAGAGSGRLSAPAPLDAPSRTLTSQKAQRQRTGSLEDRPPA